VVFVQSLCHQSERQFIAHTARLLVAGSSVLEPDLDCADAESYALSQLLSSLVADVLTVLVLGA